MLHVLETVIEQAQGRYFTKDEESRLTLAAQELPKRMRVARSVQKIERAAAEAATDRILSEYPTVSHHHAQTRDKSVRDMELTVRACVHAMVLDDLAFLDRKFLFWYKTILAGFDYTPDFLRSTFSVLEDEVTSRLKGADADAMRPYMRRTVQVLSSIDEPATPRV